MGQRHQFFAVARVRGRYRIVAAVHNQWLYGSSAVRQCLNTMQILAAPTNVPGIRRELNQAQAKPDDFWPDTSAKKGRNDSSYRCIDFPFLTTCLLLGSGVPPNSGQGSPAHELSIDIHYKDCWNDDGISIFDVTDVGNPKYAMIFTDEKEISIGDDLDTFDHDPVMIDSCTILTASDYMQHYQPPRTSENVQDPKVQALDALLLLDVAALNDVWPTGAFQARGASCSISTAETENVVPSGINSLRQSSMRTVMDKGMENDPSDDSWLTEAEQIPGFTELFRAYLYEHPSKVHDVASASILGRVLKGNTTIDLSPFSSLSLEGVLAVLDIAASDSNSTLSLALPDMKDLTAERLCRLLSTRCINKLDLGVHQVGNISDVIHCIEGTSVTSFTTSDSFSRAFFKPRDQMADIIRDEDGLHAKPWSECCPVAILPSPQQCNVTQLVYMARFGIKPSTQRTMLAIAQRNASSNCAPFMPIQPLEQGKWTILVCYESQFTGTEPVRLRYAFVTLDSHGRTLALGSSELLREINPTGADPERETKWEDSAAKLRENLELKQRDRDEFSVRQNESHPGSLGFPFPTGGNTPSPRFGVCSVEEVHEVFQGLASVGRFASFA